MLRAHSRGRVRDRTRDRLEKAEQAADALLARVPNSYPAMLLKGLAAFELRADVREAKRWIKHCEGTADPAWRYSEGFLHAYERRLDLAYSSYRKAFDKQGARQLPVEVEEFIMAAVEREPERAELAFCLGLLNRYAKDDAKAASRDFARFLQLAPPNAYLRQKALAKKWIEEQTHAPIAGGDIDLPHEDAASAAPP